MKQIAPDLWQTPKENPFPGLYTHAYLYRHESGNVLFYNTGLSNVFDRMAELGGVRWQFLSHQDELGDGILDLRRRFGTELGGHVNELQEFARLRTPDWVFDQRERGPAGSEIIPTPGHTPGSTSFLVNSASGQRYLFTGDTLYFNDNNELDVAYFPGHSDARLYQSSLETLATLSPHLVLSSACSRDANGYRALTSQQWQASIELARQRLLERTRSQQQTS